MPTWRVCRLFLRSGDLLKWGRPPKTVYRTMLFNYSRNSSYKCQFQTRQLCFQPIIVLKLIALDALFKVDIYDVLLSINFPWCSIWKPTYQDVLTPGEANSYRLLHTCTHKGETDNKTGLLIKRVYWWKHTVNFKKL